MSSTLIAAPKRMVELTVDGEPVRVLDGNTGASCAQRASATGQRVRKTQPVGGASGDGISPASNWVALPRSSRGSGMGMADSSARV